MNKIELFHKFLREEREKEKLSQEKLADLANINVKYLGKIERYECHPSFEKMVAICNALKLHINVKNFEVTEFEKDTNENSNK